MQADRDSSAWEAEELRGQVMVLEQRLSAVTAAAETEATAKGDALHALSEARQRVADLSIQACAAT